MKKKQNKEYGWTTVVQWDILLWKQNEVGFEKNVEGSSSTEHWRLPPSKIGLLTLCIKPILRSENLDYAYHFGQMPVFDSLMKFA